MFDPKSLHLLFLFYNTNELVIMRTETIWVLNEIKNFFDGVNFAVKEYKHSDFFVESQHFARDTHKLLLKKKTKDFSHFQSHIKES